MKNRKVKIAIISIACVAALAAAIFAFVYFKAQKDDYPSETKNAVAMNTVITSKIYGASSSHNDQIIKIIDGLEDTISWRKEGSAVWSVNHGKKVKLAELAQILANCKRVSDSTDGRFDVTVGSVSSLWDIGGENERKPSKKEIEKALKTVDYSKLNYQSGIVFAGDGQQLDLGAVGKGYACDMIENYLSMTDVPGAVVSVGGSILAYGSRNKAGDPWRIAIKHPRKDDAFLGTISLKSGFVSTSGDYERYFEEDGIRYHHILDAKTGYPAQSDLISVTVVANSGILADALSTACFIVGAEESKALLESFGCSAVFVDQNQNVSTFGSIDFEENK